MVLFKKTEHDFGTVKEKTVQNTTFKSNYEIVAAEADCGCTIPLVQGKQLVVSATMSRLPNAMSEYHFNRNITVTVKVEDQVFTTVLKIKALIKRDI